MHQIIFTIIIQYKKLEHFSQTYKKNLLVYITLEFLEITIIKLTRFLMVGGLIIQKIQNFNSILLTLYTLIQFSK